MKKIDCLYVLVKFDFYKDISFWEKGRIELKFIICHKMLGKYCNLIEFIINNSSIFLMP